MIAWHILHSDLPKGLGFVATFTCPWQQRWKHMSHSHPGLYNCIDADVELRSMIRIEEELRKNGLWGVYQRDVIDLEPILHYMTEMGMPIDHETRVDRAVRLAEKMGVCKGKMEGEVPLNARMVDHVFVNEPKEKDGLLTRPGHRASIRCPLCGAIKPRKDHFKTFVRKANPCAGASPEECVIDVTEFYRLKPFKPSRSQLINYQKALGRQVPTTFDNKTKSRRLSMNEKAIKGLMVKFPNDKLYPLVLEYRELEKVAGTYIGKPLTGEEGDDE
jgi:hypothetical protein